MLSNKELADALVTNLSNWLPFADKNLKFLDSDFRF